MTMTCKTGQDVFWAGSLHKYHQDGTNFAPFPYRELFYSIREFSDRFGVNPLRAELHNVEFGVNLHNFPLSFRQLQKALLTFKGKEFIVFDSVIEGLGIKARSQRYNLKIYDKARQFNQPGNVIRFEIQVKKMIFLAEVGIKYVADLLDQDKLRQIEAILGRVIDDLLMNDHRIDLKRMSKPERDFFKVAQYPRYWSDLKELNTRTRDNRRRRFRDIVRKYQPETLQDQLKNSVLVEWQGLLDTPPGILTQVAEFLNRWDSNSQKISTKLTGSENPDLYQINNSDVWLERYPTPTTSTRACKVCACDISDRRRDAIFCSKRCRNQDSNPRNNPRNYRKRKFGTYLGISLFQSFP
ncbi:MAG: hypothetical protein H6581_06410 [Bacteroidia bacterium]|nr:hypothetical protein [Bacteroidia bacterium]